MEKIRRHIASASAWVGATVRQRSSCSAARVLLDNTSLYKTWVGDDPISNFGSVSSEVRVGKRGQDPSTWPVSLFVRFGNLRFHVSCPGLFYRRQHSSGSRSIDRIDRCSCSPFPLALESPTYTHIGRGEGFLNYGGALPKFLR